jgi:alginate O-acetyltransferase complex protein AlgI
MVFSSLIFVFVFLTTNLIVYYALGPKSQNKVMLVFSLIFYAWGGPRYLLLLAGETLASWFFALRIEEARGGYTKQSEKFYLVWDVVVMLTCLGIFKYLGFFLTNFQAIFKVPKVIPEIVLPIGISFYTFQLISYVADVYKGRVKAQREYWKLLLYSSLFHQCIAGPIVRYETVAEEIDNRSVNLNDLYTGIRRFSVGLAKKAILANSCASISDTLLPEGIEALKAQTTLGMWLGMIFYMLEIYLDFSAYSDMAIGMGRMIGFHYDENFNYPYMAKSVNDFWRRWHISLSSFFKDYVYIPLGGNRCSTWKYIRNMAVVWFLTGMWHGASWNYILWGLYYLVFLLLEKFFLGGRMGPVVSRVYTLLVILFGWTIFRFENMGELGTVLKGMFGIGNAGFANLTVGTTFVNNIFFLIFAVIACTNLGKEIKKRALEVGKVHNNVFMVCNIFDMVIPALLVIVSAVALAGDSYNPFLYFQF